MRLTELSRAAGCGCKLGPEQLAPVLAGLPRPDDPALLVGFDTSDDAAVYRVSDELAIVSTADFFTPIADDPYDFGRIAAANALSDVYAMGATPLTALNLVAWSLDEHGSDALAEVLRGGADTAREAGVAVVGGHSIDDREPKYGMAVTGTVHPDRLLRNSTARAGDELWLTKPIGGGAATTAAKRRLPGAEPVVAGAIEVMAQLNAGASRAALDAGAHAMTDVTGFGLLGHLHELARGSGVAAEVDASAVPAIDGVLDLLAGEQPPIAGGTRRNRAWLEPHVTWDAAVAEEARWLLCDAMTSGGLLVALPAGVDGPGRRVGRVIEGHAGAVSVVSKRT